MGERGSPPPSVVGGRKKKRKRNDPAPGEVRGKRAREEEGEGRRGYAVADVAEPLHSLAAPYIPDVNSVAQSGLPGGELERSDLMGRLGAFDQFLFLAEECDEP